VDESKYIQIALFRYGIISDIVNQVCLPPGKQEELIRYKCSCIWKIPYTNRTRIARTTILCWIKRYNNGGKKIESLYPKARNDRNKTRVIDDQTAKNLTWLTKNSDINSVKTILLEMNRQELVNPGTILAFSTVYRFLRQNNLTDYLKKRKKFSRRKSDNSVNEKLWLRTLMMGKIPLSELKQDLCSKMSYEDIETLYDCALNKPLYYRKRAIGILSLYKGISLNTITEYLFIVKSTLRHNFRTYQKDGMAPIISDKGKRTVKSEDPKYVEKVFTILHSPPSLYGFNRTTWRQADIYKTLSNANMPVSKHVIKQIIENSGYKYRKARTVLTSNDPKYRDKITKIKNILSNLGPKEKFFSIDEYGPFAVKLQGGRSLVPPGTTKVVPQWQKSKGSIIITASLELSTNQITHFYSKNKNTTEMIKLLDILVEKCVEEECIYFSWDAASWHASKKLYKRVKEINNKENRENTKSPIVKLAPLPTCAQFLNVIESVFSGMARAIIHNSDYKSVSECKSAIDQYFSERNKHFQKNPKKAGNKIWGKERVKATFSESHNCKDPMYR
jgi:transposase